MQAPAAAAPYSFQDQLLSAILATPRLVMLVGTWRVATDHSTVLSDRVVVDGSFVDRVIEQVEWDEGSQSRWAWILQLRSGLYIAIVFTLANGHPVEHGKATLTGAGKVEDLSRWLTQFFTPAGLAGAADLT